jgi:glutamate synthase domain-containing protein 2
MIIREILFGRFTVWTCSIILALGSLAGLYSSTLFIWPLALFSGLAILGLRDFLKSTHPVRANYPLMGRLRYLFESVRPELRQYFWESDDDELPYSRNQRAMVYQRAKGVLAARPFGSLSHMYDEGHSWLAHSMNPIHIDNPDFRFTVGQGEKQYRMSFLNISGMSFGALSPTAVAALNKGAKLGGFAQNTGEGSLSEYHEQGGDIIWQISTGYFGCRTPNGHFDADRFGEKATTDQVKMVEIKLSQGAKPGHGGMLLASKVTPEIAKTRGIPAWQDCISPSSHREFSTPNELLDFVERLRTLSGGKPVGIKLCVGHPWEIIAFVKAMVERQIFVDFITVDVAEGGTGAAPVEFADHIGVPLRDGVVLVDNVLRAAGLRSRINIGASGKMVSAWDMIRVSAIGADWINMARPFMFALGCIQARDCASGHCPTGITTMDPARYRAIDIDSRAQRVMTFHKNTLEAVAEMLGAAGIDHPIRLNRRHVERRVSGSEIKLADEVYPKVETGALFGDGLMDDMRIKKYWPLVNGDSFDIQEV